MMSSVGRSSPLYISREYVYYAMLNLFSDLGQVHVFSTPSRTLDLNLISIELMKPLETLDQQEVYS
jgi:hypothetical protein